jgi:hypothetical protein
MISLKKDKNNYRVTIGEKEFKIEDACDGRMFAECDVEDLCGVSAASFPRNLTLRVNSIDRFGTIFFDTAEISAYKGKIRLEFIAHLYNKYWEGYFGLSNFIMAINQQVQCFPAFKVTDMEIDDPWKGIIICKDIPSGTRFDNEIQNAASDLKQLIKYSEIALYRNFGKTLKIKPKRRIKK